MLSHEMHLLVKSLDTCHVSSSIISKFHFLTAADVLCSPVEISHIYRTSDFACYCVETCLPTLYRLTGSLRCKCQMYDLLGLHLLDHTKSDVAASLSVHRNATKLSQKPSERTDKHFTFYHAVRLTAHRHII